MLSSRKILIYILTLTCAFTAEAQNTHFDWGIGFHPSIYSFSAVRNKTITSPYEYHRGMGFTFSRYINNNFDVMIEGGRSQHVMYPVGDYIVSGGTRAWEYQETNFYDAQFSVKYKLNNGYVLSEKFVAGPFIKLGFGANKSDEIENFDYYAPVGIGTTLSMGKYMSFMYQSSFKYSFQTPKSYTNHSLGLIINFGPASNRRIIAMRKRDRKFQAARIARYRAKRANQRAKEANSRLVKIQDEPLSEEVVATRSSIEEPKPAIKPLGSQTEEVTETISEETISLPPLKPKETEVAEVLTQTESKVETNVPVNTEPAEKEVAEKHEILPPSPRPVIPEFEEPPIPGKPIVVAETTLPKVEVEEPSVPTSYEEETMVYTEIEDDYCANSSAMMSRLGEFITFDSDRTRLRSRTHKYLQQVVKIMDKCGDMSYVIVAHADADGDEEYNKKLSMKRAEAVKAFLIDSGISPSRLVTVAYGEAVQVYSSKEKNRRVEFKTNYRLEDLN